MLDVKGIELQKKITPEQDQGHVYSFAKIENFYSTSPNQSTKYDSVCLQNHNQQKTRNMKGSKR